jgi:hypothetical protein
MDDSAVAHTTPATPTLTDATATTSDGAAQSSVADFSVLTALMEQLPDVFLREVLDQRLFAIDRFLLGQSNLACRTFLKVDAAHLARDITCGVREAPVRRYFESSYTSLFFGPPAVFFWAVANGFKWRAQLRVNPRMRMALAKRGKLEVLRWGEQNGYALVSHWDVLDVCVGAAEGGQVHVLRWLMEDLGRVIPAATRCIAFDAAVDMMHWDVVDFLATTGNALDQDVLSASSRHYQKVWFAGRYTRLFFKRKLDEVIVAENTDGIWAAAVKCFAKELAMQTSAGSNDNLKAFFILTLFVLTQAKVTAAEREKYRRGCTS